jgi:hypothetical protein
MGKQREAELAAGEAVALLQGSPPDCAVALAALSRVLLAQERSAEALAAAEEAMAVLRELGTIQEGESLIRLAFAEALLVLGDARAQAAVDEAQAALLARAASIADPAGRRSFLERVPENVRTAELAARSVQT